MNSLKYDRKKKDKRRVLNGLNFFIHNYIKFRWCRKKPLIIDECENCKIKMNMIPPLNKANARFQRCILGLRGSW